MRELAEEGHVNKIVPDERDERVMFIRTEPSTGIGQTRAYPIAWFSLLLISYIALHYSDTDQDFQGNVHVGLQRVFIEKPFPRAIID